jgi:DNA-binding response OmpR family regulator
MGSSGNNKTVGNPTGYRLFDEHRVLLCQEDIIRFTPTEYPLVKLLLRGELVTDQQLLSLLSGFLPDEGGPDVQESEDLGVSHDGDEGCRAILWRHVTNLRRKLGSHFHLSRAEGLGYILVASQARPIFS